MYVLEMQDIKPIVQAKVKINPEKTIIIESKTEVIVFTIKIICYSLFFFFTFTLYPIYSSVASVVIGHSVLNFKPNFRDIAYWLTERNTALGLVTRTKRWKWFIPWVGIKPTSAAFTVRRYAAIYVGYNLKKIIIIISLPANKHIKVNKYNGCTK